MVEPTPPLRNTLRFVKRQAWLIILVPAIALAATAVVTMRQQSVYRASMSLIVAQVGGGTTPQLGNLAANQTVAGVLRSDAVAQRAIDRLGLDVTPEKLLNKVKVKVKPDNSVVEVTYDATSRTQAAIVLSAVARSFREVARRNLGVTGIPKRPGPLHIIASPLTLPHADPGRVSPTPGKDLAFAGLLGLALGLVMAFGRESLDDKVRGRAEAEEWFGAPVVGTIPRAVRSKPVAGVGARRRGDDRMLQAMQLLRANLQFSNIDVSGPTFLVTSALRNEGKTILVANLGVALALAGNDVICVEADLQRPRLHERLGIAPQSVGLVEVLQGRAQPEAVLQDVALAPHSPNGNRPVGTEDATSVNGGADVLPAGEPRLRLLPAGDLRRSETPSEPVELLSSARIGALVRRLAEHADYVIFDSPPLLSAGEVFPLALSLDGVIVAARQGRTSKDGARAVRATLAGLGMKKVAVVLVDSTTPSVRA